MAGASRSDARGRGIDISGERPKKLDLEMQLHADWAITLGCGGACPYVPTRVDDWDVADPHGQSLDEVRATRFWQGMTMCRFDQWCRRSPTARRVGACAKTDARP
jgi:hypothetical protein